MRHLCPALCGSDAGSPAGGTQSIAWTPLPPSAGIGEPMSWTRLVLAGLLGVMTSEGLPAHTSTSKLSAPGDAQLLPAALRWNVTLMVLCLPGAALFRPEVWPGRVTSGPRHPQPPAVSAPASP